MVQGTCIKCGQEFSGFGDTCGSCRKLGTAGTYAACAHCGEFFQGFGTFCAECQEKQGGKAVLGVVNEDEEGVADAPSLMKKELREHMASILMAAVKNGKLDEAAATVSMLAQREARGSIIKWDKMGSIVIDKPAAITVADLRTRTQQVLKEACRSGRLEEVASSLPPLVVGDRAARPDGPLKKKVSRIFE